MTIQVANAERIQESLAEAGLILPGPAEEPLEDFKPTVNLEVSYTDEPFELGASFPASECKVAPAIAFAPEVHSLATNRFGAMLTDSPTRVTTSGPGPHTH